MAFNELITGIIGGTIVYASYSYGNIPFLPQQIFVSIVAGIMIFIASKT